MSFQDAIKKREQNVEITSVKKTQVETKPDFGRGRNTTFGLNGGRPVNEGANSVDRDSN